MIQRDILTFWRDVEIFDLPDLKKEATLITPKDNLPWLNAVKAAKKNYKWKYTLYFGKIEKKKILAHLNTLLKADEVNDWEEPMQGFSCVSALILDENGRPQQDSYVVASYAYGIKVLEKEKELSTVTKELDDAREEFLERYNIPQLPIGDKEQKYPKGDVVSWDYIYRELNYLDKLTSWAKQQNKVFLLIEEVPKDSEPNTGFLNSFFLDDLNLLCKTKETSLSKSLQQYLSLNIVDSERRDLIQNKKNLFETINPCQLSAGRWPSKINYGLYTAQSGAVNTIFSTLRNSEGIQGVNGPPGTGKTTLLLDVIAEIIVDRAKVISEIGYNKLFNSGYKKIEKENGFSLYTYNLNPKLKNNFGIVIASNNNAAVENISKELPSKSKIDTAIFNDADYFSECATKLIEEESWGVLAAALGNATNRSNFKKSFWTTNLEDGTIGFSDLLYDIYKDENNDKSHQFVEAFELEHLKFKNLLDEFEAFKQIASQFHELLPEFIDSKRQETSCITQLENNEEKRSQLEKEKQIFSEQENKARKGVERVQSTLHLHSERKPSFFFFHKLFNTKNFQQWNSEAGVILAQLHKLNNELETLNNDLKNNNIRIQELSIKQSETKSILNNLGAFFQKYSALQNELNQKYEIDTKNIFDISFHQKEILDIHLLNPYHSPKIGKLRSDIFLSALRLHRNAILANAKNVKNNLNAYFEMTSGWVKVDDAISQNLWDTFFLCVPVVSTTLASASKLFPITNKQQLGWLLIDEAGQATPQSVVGLIHRSKRCVIVGDPLQVEPVVTMPEKLMIKLRNENNVSVDWSPLKVSVQQLADRISKLGSYMAVGDTDEKIWTGFPLRTHRRCDNPMFSIANTIAYSKQIVKAVNENSPEEFLGDSSWFNVNTEPTLVNKHVVIEEINLLTQKIKTLRDNGFKDEIYVISPFKSIANYCENTFRDDKKISCGTIHKFQGKEADIVFLVLGSDPKSTGARNWASQKPNMLNVALTRAKKRFYVIGSKKYWGTCNYYSTMLRALN